MTPASMTTFFTFSLDGRSNITSSRARSRMERSPRAPAWPSPGRVAHGRRAAAQNIARLPGIGLGANPGGEADAGTRAAALNDLFQAREPATADEQYVPC